MENALKQVVFGIRHKRRFGVADNLGTAVDMLVEFGQRGDILPPDFFKKIKWDGGGKGASVSDNDESLSVRIDIDNIILTFDCQSGFRYNMDVLGALFVSICHVVLTVYEISNLIERIGIVETYEFQDLDNSADFITHNIMSFTAERPAVADTCALRYVFKIPAKEALKLRDIDDYFATIIQISSGKERPSGMEELSKEATITLDLQHYFIPPIEFSDDIVSDQIKWVGRHSAEIKKGQLAGFFDKGTSPQE